MEPSAVITDGHAGLSNRTYPRSSGRALLRSGPGEPVRRFSDVTSCIVAPRTGRRFCRTRGRKCQDKTQGGQRDQESHGLFPLSIGRPRNCAPVSSPCLRCSRSRPLQLSPASDSETDPSRKDGFHPRILPSRVLSRTKKCYENGRQECLPWMSDYLFSSI
jgi:hypothetical protein